MKKLLIPAALAGLAFTSASAANLTWDTSPGIVGAGDSLITGGAGTWNTTNGDWTSDAGANNVSWTNANIDSAIFSGTAGMVTLETGITTADITFGTSGYTLAGGALTLAGATTSTNVTGSVITVTNANDLVTITSQISGSTATKALIKKGSGILVLDNATNNIAGNTAIDAGTLRVTSSGSLGTGSFLIVNNTGAVFASAGSAALTVSKSLRLDGSGGSVILGDAVGTGDLTFTGDLSRASGTSNRTVSVAGIRTTFNGNLIGTGANASTSFTKGGSGILTIKGVGSADVGYSSVLVTGGTLEVTRLADLGTASSLGKGGVATAGAVSLVLNGGTLAYIDGGAAASSTNRQLQIGQTAAGGAGTVLNNAASATETVTFSNVAAVAYGTTNQTRSLTLGGTNAGANTFASLIGNNGTGAVSFAKNDSGRWVLTGANTFSGGTLVSAGTLVTGHASALGAGNVTVNAGALQIGDGATNNLTLGSGSNLVLAAGAKLTLGSGTSGVILQGTGGFTLTGGVIDLNGMFDSLGGTTTYNLISGGSGTKTAGASVTGFNTGVFSSVTIDNTGTLTFTAVPEPSAYGLIGAGTLAATHFLRRKKKALPIRTGSL